MKQGIHPEYVPVTITCIGCSTVYDTRSTAGKDYHIEICANCHPFFTGRQRLLDTAGRVERFRRKYAKPEGGANGEAPAPKA